MTVVPSSDGDYIATGGVDGFVKMWSSAGDMVWERDEGAVISALHSSVDSFGTISHSSRAVHPINRTRVYTTDDTTPHVSCLLFLLLS